MIDQSQPDLIITNLQGSPVATIVAVENDPEAQGVQFFNPISVNVLNSGDDIAPAGYSVSFFLSRRKVIDDSAIQFRSVSVNVTLQIGDFTRVTTNNSNNTELSGGATSITAGSYFLLARVGGATELDTGNNDTQAIGVVQVVDPRPNINSTLETNIPSEANARPNFVLEKVSAPSFAFAQDSVNASQQPVTEDRLVKLSIELALRSAATTVQEDFELQAFLSTDQILSDDDIRLLAPIPDGQVVAPPINFSFPASSSGTVRQFSNFSVLMPRIADIPVTLPQTFFVIVNVIPQGSSGSSSQEVMADNYDNTRGAGIRTRVYGRFLQSDKAILPDLTVDGLTRTDPDALEFTTTAFSIPSPGSQRIFSFQIPDAANINPDESQVLILLQSNDFDPTLDLVSPLGNSISLSDDSVSGQPAFISQPLTATGEGNNIFYVVISSLSGTGSGNFNLTIFLQSRTDPNKPVIAPVNLGNLLSLDRGRATVTAAANFPVALTEASSFTVRVDGNLDVPFTFSAGNAIANLAQATLDEVVSELQRQITAQDVTDRIRVGKNADNKLFVSSLRTGLTSTLVVTDGVGTPAATLRLPLQESGLSERSVTFTFQQAQEDTEFVFFVPFRGAFDFRVEPSLDLFGGVTASLQFFDGVSQTSISLEKMSEGADRTLFRGPNNSPLVLDRGFYALIFNAPQPILNTDFRLTFNSRFDRSVNPR